MKKIKKIATAVTAGSLLLGVAGTSGAYSLWADEVAQSVSISAPSATLDVKVGTRSAVPLIDATGGVATVDSTKMPQYTQFADIPEPRNSEWSTGNSLEGTTLFEKSPAVNDSVLTPADYDTLVRDHKIVKPVTVTGQTTGEIGLSHYSIALGNVNWDKTAPTGLSLNGPLLSMTDATKNRFVKVSSPAQCSAAILDAPNTSNSYETANNKTHDDDTEKLATADNMLGDEVAVGANQKRQDVYCLALQLPEKDDSTAGAHKNTATVEGTVKGTGSGLSAEDSWEAQVDAKTIDYTKPLADQKRAGDTRVALYSSSVNNSGPYKETVKSVYSTGKFDYRKYVGTNS